MYNVNCYLMQYRIEFKYRCIFLLILIIECLYRTIPKIKFLDLSLIENCLKQNLPRFDAWNESCGGIFSIWAETNDFGRILRFEFILSTAYRNATSCLLSEMSNKPPKMKSHCFYHHLSTFLFNDMSSILQYKQISQSIEEYAISIVQVIYLIYLKHAC